MQIDIPVILKYSATVQGIMKKFKKVQTRKTVKVERDPRYHIMWQNKCSDEESENNHEEYFGQFE